MGIDETYFSVLDYSCCDLILSGYAILEPRAKEDPSEGYALLYDLVAKEKRSSQSVDHQNKETTKQMLRSTGVDLEFNMVSSQLAAVKYAVHLARSSDRKFPDLHGQVYKMLSTRYQR